MSPSLTDAAMKNHSPTASFQMETSSQPRSPWSTRSLQYIPELCLIPFPKGAYGCLPEYLPVGKRNYSNSGGGGTDTDSELILPRGVTTPSSEKRSQSS